MKKVNYTNKPCDPRRKSFMQGRNVGRKSVAKDIEEISKNLAHIKAEISALISGYDSLENFDEWIESRYLHTAIKKLRELVQGNVCEI